jgi:hypothetical protein
MLRRAYFNSSPSQHSEFRMSTLASASPVPAFHPPAHAAQAVGSGADGWWGLLYQGWILSTPDGQRLHLTAVERACFLCLLASPQRELTRDALAQRVPHASIRTINVAISRLRKKVAALGAALPLHTVHGMGYVFLGHLIAEGMPS